MKKALLDGNWQVFFVENWAQPTKSVHVSYLNINSNRVCDKVPIGKVPTVHQEMHSMLHLSGRISRITVLTKGDK